MSLSAALELPDEQRSLRRGSILGAVGAAVVVAGAVVVARTFALGGFPRANLVVGVVLLVPTALASWALCGPYGRRSTVTALAIVVAALLVPVASAGVTPSTARLASLVDAMHLPGKVAREVRIGNGRCRDACSEIRRVAYVDGPAFAKVYSAANAALVTRGFEVKRYAYASGAPARIDAKYKNLLVSIEVRSVGLARTRIATVVLADGPAPSHRVG